MLAPAALQVHVSLAGRSWDLGIRFGWGKGGWEEEKSNERLCLCLASEEDTVGEG